MFGFGGPRVDKQGRCSVAHQKHYDFPFSLFHSEKKRRKIRELDLSHNYMQELPHLATQLPHLESLVLDNNRLKSHALNGGSLPASLRLLYCNSNKITNLSAFVENVAANSPHLLFFSMLNNEACPNFFNGGTVEQYQDYRYFVISRLPELQVLDSTPVTEEERSKALEAYGDLTVKPFLKLQEEKRLKKLKEKEEKKRLREEEEKKRQQEEAEAEKQKIKQKQRDSLPDVDTADIPTLSPPVLDMKPPESMTPEETVQSVSEGEEEEESESESEAEEEEEKYPPPTQQSAQSSIALAAQMAALRLKQRKHSQQQQQPEGIEKEEDEEEGDGCASEKPPQTEQHKRGNVETASPPKSIAPGIPMIKRPDSDDDNDDDDDEWD